MGTEKVHFHVGRFGHPYFVEQMQCAPDGFLYSGAGEDDGAGPRRLVIQSSRFRRARSAAELAAIRGLSFAGYIRRRALRPPPDCVLIHSAQQLLRHSERPYVLDFECVEVFSLYQRVALSRPWARRALLEALLDERCRFLLPWSRAAARGLGSALGDAGAARLAGKTRVVLPAIRPRTATPSERRTGPLRVLFVGTAFEAKGGVEAIRALVRVQSTHDVVLDVISDLPARWSREAQHDGITVHRWPAPAATIRELYERAHLLLFPSHMDTLGFVMLEAMAHGVPVLATRHFAVPELVKDGVSGLVVDGENLLYADDGLSRFDRTLPPPRSFRRALRAPSSHYVDRLAVALARVAEDRDLHGRLAAGALARVQDGPLSVERRRDALARIYRDAIAG